MALLVLAALVVALTAALGAAALRLPGTTDFLLAAYVLAFGEIVLLTEVLSPFRAVGRAGYGAGEAVLLVAAGAAWQLRGRLVPPRPAPILRRLPAHPVVALLGVGVAGGLLYSLVVGLTTPPGNWDSLTYHLARVAAWLQHGGVQYVQAATERANAFQPGAEMVLLWTMVFPHRDTAVALPQLVAEMAALVAVYGIGRRLGAGRAAAAFAALLAGTLTEIALQGVTTQNDLTGAALVAVTAYFAFGRTRTDLALGGLAFGLAIGVKLTAVYALPVLLALVVTRRGLRRLPEAAALAAAGVVLLGLFGYALNLGETGHVLGRASRADEQRATITASGTVSTVARLGWRFVDVSGFHPRTAWTEGVGRAGKAVFAGLGIPANPPAATGQRFDFTPNSGSSEDISFFGPLGILLVVPLSLAFLAGVLARRTSWEKGVLALALPLYALEIALTYRYNGWLGRFLIAPVLLTMPLAAILYTRRAAAGLAALIAGATLLVAQMFNQTKPTGFDGTTPVWSLSRTEAQTILRPRLAAAFTAIDAEGARLGEPPLGVVAGNDDWVYPLYGASLQRHVEVLAGADPLAEAERRGLRWVAVAGDAASKPPARHGWSALRLGTSGWSLIMRQGLR